MTRHSLARTRERAVDLMPSPKAANRCSLVVADATAATNKTHAPGRKLRHQETEPCRRPCSREDDLTLHVMPGDVTAITPGSVGPSARRFGQPKPRIAAGVRAVI